MPVTPALFHCFIRRCVCVCVSPQRCVTSCHVTLVFLCSLLFTAAKVCTCSQWPLSNWISTSNTLLASLTCVKTSPTRMSCRFGCCMLYVAIYRCFLQFVLFRFVFFSPLRSPRSRRTFLELSLGRPFCSKASCIFAICAIDHLSKKLHFLLIAPSSAFHRPL